MIFTSKPFRVFILFFMTLQMMPAPFGSVASAQVTTSPASQISNPLIAASAAESTQVSSAQSGVFAADNFTATGPLSAAKTAQAQGRSLYVSNRGSDSSNGSQYAAWKTIAYAVGQLRAGDTLYITEGTYQQPGAGAVFKSSGTSDAYITVQGLGNVIIQGTSSTVISGYSVAANYNPAFDTKGQDFIRFRNLTVNNLRDAVEVSPSSSYIEIDGLRSNNNHFAVKINGGDHVTVRNVVVVNSRNGFRTESSTGILPTDILFENITVSGSKDVYSGFESKYRNGDGFILEFGNRITLRNVVSHDNWDGGFDVKATNVLMENVITFGNKNNFKIWGSGIVVKNALSYGAKIRRDDPVAGEGYGVNARMGQATFINSTFVDNENVDVRVDNDGGAANITFKNCIIARRLAYGNMFANDGGKFTENNNLWYWQGKNSPGLSLSSPSFWADPKFINWSGKDFRLQAGSQAIDKGNSSFSVTVSDLAGQYRMAGRNVDMGAYESGSTPAPVTRVSPTPNPNPVSTANCATAICGIASGQTVSGTILVQPNRVMNPDIHKVSYYLNGNLSSREYAAPFIWGGSGFDTRKLADGQYTLGGSFTGENGDQSFAISFTIKNAGISAPEVGSCTTPICGISASQIVNGVIRVQPNLSLNPDIRKVGYFLNGTFINREYAPAFTFGGPGGFDTSKLANGNHTLSGAYTNGSGDHNFSITFTVNRSVVISTNACASVICGVSVGQTVRGTIKIQPDLKQNPNIRKVAYYLDGILVSREYAAPFVINGGAGLDTPDLGDGKHTLGGSYTTTDGREIPFNIIFTVAN